MMSCLAVKERYAPKAVAPEAMRGAAPAELELIPSRQAAPKAPQPAGLGRIEAAIPEAGNIISSVEDEAQRFGTTVAPAKPGLKPIRLEPGLVGNDYTEPSTLKPTEQVAGPIVRGVKPAKVEEQLNRGLGNEPLKPGVPLREQNLIPEKPETTAEAKLSSEPRKAALQKAGATPEEIATTLPKGAKPGQTGLTRVEMSRLAEHFNVDLGESAIGRGKSDVAAGTHIPQHEVLQRIIDAGHTPAEIAKAIGEGKQLATVSGASQGYVPIPNASGESAKAFRKSTKGQALLRGPKENLRYMHPLSITRAHAWPISNFLADTA
jgi:hypothetical protein